MGTKRLLFIDLRIDPDLENIEKLANGFDPFLPFPFTTPSLQQNSGNMRACYKIEAT